MMMTAAGISLILLIVDMPVLWDACRSSGVRPGGAQAAQPGRPS
jgi:hypothetical protein